LAFLESSNARQIIIIIVVTARAMVFDHALWPMTVLFFTFRRKQIRRVCLERFMLIEQVQNLNVSLSLVRFS